MNVIFDIICLSVLIREIKREAVCKISSGCSSWVPPRGHMVMDIFVTRGCTFGDVMLHCYTNANAIANHARKQLKSC